MVEIIWTDSAIQELENIGDYIAKDSMRYAEITVAELFNSLDILEKHPRAGSKVLEFNDDQIRQIIRGNYRIVYEIISEFRIDVLTVHNCARFSKTSSYRKTKT